MSRNGIFAGIISVLLLYSCGNTEITNNQEAAESISEVWVPDLGNGKYKNPILYADYSDPDVLRVGNDYYMTSSSFNCAPGLPILHSKDMVNWQIVNYAISSQNPIEVFNKPQHGNGVWAPAIRYHNGEYYIYYGDPDYGIYMLKASHPDGEWSEPHLVKEGKGWIDPCPLWDNDGKAYLVHAFAGSRAGIKSVLLVHEMSVDGKKLLDDGVVVFDGHEKHKTVEGPKFHKRNDYYYIFAPAGGVETGWQLVLRSKDILGPYESKVVLHQGGTEINGPHQGAWVETQSGESWFFHFQDKEAYGRIVHLQPMAWENNWPLIGIDNNNDGIGEPVLEYKKPDVGGVFPLATPQSSDDFNEPKLGLQWQWHANSTTRFGYPSGRLGFFRLNALPALNQSSLWESPNLLMQKFTAEEFVATVKLDFHPKLDGDKIGMLIMGEDYAYISINYNDSVLSVQQSVCYNARLQGEEKLVASEAIDGNTFYLRAEVKTNAQCVFYYSLDNSEYHLLGETFTAAPGRWIGAKIGFFCSSKEVTNNSGYANIDWFNISK